MSTMASLDVEEDLQCSVCRDIYTDPVTLTCGHNYCHKCIKEVLDTQKRNEDDYTCPQCRKIFRRRPGLQKNTNLCNIAEKMKSSIGLESKKCPIHNKIVDLYCTKEHTCMCVLCMVENHKGHQVKPLKEASEEKKGQLRINLQKLKAERDEIDERSSQLLERKSQNRKHINDTKKKYTALIRDIRKRLRDLETRGKSEIFRQAEQKSLSTLIQNLELKKTALSKKIGHLEQLCATADPLTILQDRRPDGDTEEDADLLWINVREQDEFILAVMLHTGLSDVVKAKDDHFPVLHPTEITLDVNTAANDIHIPEDLKTATPTDERLRRPKTANRFRTGMVLSTNLFSSGQHYWVAETGTSATWEVGMCYPGMGSKVQWIGDNERSWGIRWMENSYQVVHNGELKILPSEVSFNRLGVYLNYEAGRLSFYKLSDSISLLHTFTSTFSEPLHAMLHVKKHPDGSYSTIRVL